MAGRAIRTSAFAPYLRYASGGAPIPNRILRQSPCSETTVSFPHCYASFSMPWLQHEMSIQKFKMSQRVPTGSVASSRNGKNQGIPPKWVPPCFFPTSHCLILNILFVQEMQKPCLYFYRQKSKKLYHWKGCSMQYPCKTLAYSKEKFCKFKSLFFLPGRN